MGQKSGELTTKVTTNTPIFKHVQACPLKSFSAMRECVDAFNSAAFGSSFEPAFSSGRHRFEAMSPQRRATSFSIEAEIFPMKNSKNHTRRRKPHKGKKSETHWYFIEGKWITGEQREAEMSRLKTEISQKEERLRFFQQAWKAVSDVIRLARARDVLLVELLHWIAVDTVCELDSIARESPELLQPIARETFMWPALISRKRALQRSNDELLDSLQLGEGQTTFSNSEWQPAATSTQAAFVLMTVAQAHARAGRLPSLTQQSKKQWFETSWNSMLEYGLKPEENEFLSPLGKSAIGKKSTSRGMPCQTKGMRRDDMRAEIKRRVWKAFDKLFAPDARKSK